MGIKRVKRSNSVEVGDFLPNNGKGRILKEPIGLGRERVKLHRQGTATLVSTLMGVLG